MEEVRQHTVRCSQQLELHPGSPQRHQDKDNVDLRDENCLNTASSDLPEDESEARKMVRKLVRLHRANQRLCSEAIQPVPRRTKPRHLPRHILDTDIVLSLVTTERSGQGVVLCTCV